MLKAKFTVEKMKERVKDGVKYYDITLRPSKTKITKVESDSGVVTLRVRTFANRIPTELKFVGVDAKDKRFELKKDYIVELVSATRVG